MKQYMIPLGLILILGFTVQFSFAISNTSDPLDPNPEVYTPKFDAFNIEETMTLSPMFTPDNALDIHVAWIKQAQTSIDIQNQYITQFDDGETWANDPSPFVRALVDANARGVDIRVQVREDSDSDDITAYFLSIGIEVRWMGNSASNPDGEYLSATHNKLMIIDDEVVLVSSINYGENAFTNNREAGIVVQNANAALHFKSIFDSDWVDGEIPPASLLNAVTEPNFDVEPAQTTGFPSHTDIPRTNFTGTYNITLFTNPDNADQVIFDYLKRAQESIYVSMYTISRMDFVDVLVDLKNNDPTMDIQVLISNRRVGASENVDTAEAVEQLVENLIPVYNSTKDDDKVDGFYHNKYWIIDGEHTFIYSGNWSPRSVTPQLDAGDDSYASGDPNRDMGVAVHHASDIADFVKTEVWDKDVAVASAYELPVGISISSHETADIVSGSVDLVAVSSGLTNAVYSYAIDTNAATSITGTTSGFNTTLDTTALSNGVHEITVTAESDQGTFADSVLVTVANYATSNNFRVLITELLPNPEVVDDSEGEYIEITNSFPFEVLLEDWYVDISGDVLIFPDDYSIPAYTSIIVARDALGFEVGYDQTADFEASFSLTNSNGYATLHDHNDVVIDSVAYGDETSADGSPSYDAPGSGESLQRASLHIDTNGVSDFVIGSPNPKASVPNVELSTGTEPIDTVDDTTPLDDLAFPYFGILLVIIAIPISRKLNQKSV